MEVTWREDKRRLNPRKHGLDFALAIDVSRDPFAVTVFDRVENGEERWHTIGAVLSGLPSKLSYTPTGSQMMRTGSTSSACAPLTRENGDGMKFHTSDGGVLTPEQLARLDEIEARVGGSVDFPSAREANWASAVRARHYTAAEGAISICLDPDGQA
jgi:uncharacterized DUF497 family protein